MSKDTFPSIKFSETDLTAVVRSQSSNAGALVGRFQKGPVGKPVLLTDKGDLISNFGIAVNNGTTMNNLEDWYSAANFLGYSAGLYVCRAEPVTSRNAGKNFSGTATSFASLTGGTAVYVPDGRDMELYYSTMSGTGYAGLNIIAKNPGDWGNSVSVKLATEEDLRFNMAAAIWDTYYYDYKVTLTLDAAMTGLTAHGGTSATYATSENGITGLVVSVAGGGTSVTLAYNGANVFSTAAGSGNLKLGSTYSSSGDAGISAVGTVEEVKFKDFMSNFDSALLTNEMGILVYYSGVLKEVHKVSVTSTAKNSYNQSIYVDNWLEQNSQLVSAYYNTSLAANLGYYTASAVSLAEGSLAPQSSMTPGLVISAMDDNFRDKSIYKFGFLFDGKYAYSSLVQNNIIAICESRKDCFGILSVGVTMPVTSESAAIDTASTGLTARRNALTSTTYAAFYGNFKWQFDGYTGKMFKCSVSGDIAGIYARNDLLSNPWWAPAGYNRGGIQNIEKLGINFSKANQGVLNMKQVNLVCYDQREGGYYIMTQKTLTGRPSAYSDINVRRLFTYCENAVIDAARAFQWEFNDVLTRGNFSAIVSNFLSTVKSGRGLYDYRVICDTSNNTPDIIDNNQMIMDVFVKPSKAITWITARFNATRTDANFEELVG